MVKTLLLADDSSTIRKIVELCFSDTAVRVETAESGADALSRLESLKPDIVLADVVMPEPSGYEICRHIKTSPRPVPVVLLAGTFEPFDHERAQQCGADGHLVKPFEADALRGRVEELLERTAAEQARETVERDEAGGAETSLELEEQRPDADSGPARRDAATGVRTADPAEPAPSTALVDAVARAVVERLSEQVVREIARDVVPDLAASIIRERIRELEKEES